MPSICRLVPEPPWHGEAPGLVEHEHVAILEQDHLAQEVGVGGIGGAASALPAAAQVERRHAHVLAGFQPGRDFDPFALDADLALAHDLVEMRLRQVGIAAAEPAVEPHARLVLADGDGLDARRSCGSPHERQRQPKAEHAKQHRAEDIDEGGDIGVALDQQHRSSEKVEKVV